MSGAVAASIAIIAAKQRQELLDRFRRRGAISASTALTLDELELEDNRMLRMQLREGTVVEGGGRYHLDLEALEQREYSRGMLITSLMGILVLVLLIFWIVARP